MSHELAGALQQAGRIRQRCAVKEPHVYVRREYIDVAEGRISQTCNRTAVVQELPNFVPAFSHRLKPLVRDGSEFTRVLFHPPIDGGIPLDGAVESQQFRSHRRSAFCPEVYSYTLPALTIALIYKSRWQVELFFKWIKQHLRIKSFYGTSENAVKTQIWIAVSVYVLVAIVRKRFGLEISPYQILQILSVMLFEKTPILQALQPPNSQNDSLDSANQLILFDL
jgi:hypothetical protein